MTHLFLLKQNRQLKQLTENSNQSAVTVGTKILPLSGLDATGNKVEVDSNAERKTLLLVFSATCHFCEKNASNWKEILQNIKSDKISIVGVALGKDGEEFLKKHGLDGKFSTVSLLPDKSSPLPIFDVTPQTILLNSNGEAEKVWSGVLDKKNFNEVLDSVVAVKSAD